jgi:hypothetical protein
VWLARDKLQGQRQTTLDIDEKTAATHISGHYIVAVITAAQNGNH